MTSTKVKIVFFAWDTTYGKLIRFHTKSKWTHVGIVAAENTEGFICFEALNKGLIKTHYSRTQMTELERQGLAVVKEVDLRVSEQKLWDTCAKYEGTPYDWISIINIALYSILGRRALNFSGPRAVICSEYVARVLYELSGGQINFENIYGKKFDLITPAELFKWVMGDE